MKQKNTEEVRCDSCGNITTDPYVYHIVPSPYLHDWKSIPPYIKSAFIC